MYSNSVQLLQSSLMTHVESTQHVSEHLKPNCFHWATSFMQSMRSVYGTVSFAKYVYCSQKKKKPCAMYLRAVGQAGGHGEGASMSQSFHRIQSAHSLWSQIKSSPVQGLYTKTKPTSFQRYVFSSGGTSCMVTAVDPLFVLNCSKRVSSALLSSALGSWTVFSKAGLELPMPPDTEGIHRSFIGTLLWATDGLIFWRGLEPEVPRTLDTWVRLATSERTIKITYSVVIVIVLLFLYYSLDISFNNYYAEFTLLYCCFSTINYLALQWTLTKKSLFVFFYLRHFAVSVRKIHKVLETKPLRR